MPSDAKAFAKEMVDSFRVPYAPYRLRCGESTGWGMSDECDVVVEQVLEGKINAEVVIQCGTGDSARAANDYFLARLRARVLMTCKGTA